MTPLALSLPALPVAAIETGLFLFAAPLILLMAIWAVITAARILYPEAPLPPDAGFRSRRRGEPAPVRLRQIVDEQRRRPAPVFPRVGGAPEGVPPGELGPDPLADALWERRN